MAASYSVFLSTVVSAALGVSGCSTTVTYTNPKSTAVRSKLPDALDYLGQVRDSYQKSVVEQMKNEQMLANALIGGGALAMALAVGGANANIIAGTALAAGTTYAIGNFNLPRHRVLVYMAGIDALGCARRATAPIYVTAEVMQRIEPSLDELSGLISALEIELRKGRTSQGAMGTEPYGIIGDALELGATVRTAAESTLSGGRDFVSSSRRAAVDLFSAVERIDESVATAQVNGTPALSSVPGLIGGLAGVSGSFVPGVGLDSFFTGKLTSAVAEGLNKGSRNQRSGEGNGSQYVPPPPPDPAVKAAIGVATAIYDAARRANAEASKLLVLLPKPVRWADDAFKDCGVAQIVAALTVSDSPLQMTTGVDATRTFEIFGGVKPYFVRLQGPPVDGLSVTSPIRFDNQAQLIAVGAKVKTPVGREAGVTVRVFDSSPGGRSLDIPVVISTAASAPK